MIVAFRKRTLLPLDDCLYALQASIPNLTRSSLHRCLQRHGISRLPDMTGEAPAKKHFTPYLLGYKDFDDILPDHLLVVPSREGRERRQPYGAAACYAGS